MHELRSAILSGDGVRPETPIASKKPGRATPSGGSLSAVAVRRQEPRLTNQRHEDRHRDIIDDAVVYFRRRKHGVSVVNVSSAGVMIECELKPRIGETVEIRFEGCNRTKCAVRWVRENRIGLEFRAETGIIGSQSVQDFIIRRLRGHEEETNASAGETSSTPDRAPRHGLIWMGTLHCKEGSIPARLRNISAEGAMVETAQPFEIGAEVLLDLDHGGTVFARTCWTEGGQLGLTFDQKFDLKKLAEARPTHVRALAVAQVVKPEYLESDGKPDCPWSARWERLKARDL